MHVYKVSVVLVDTRLQRLVITGIASLLAEHSRSFFIDPGLPTLRTPTFCPVSSPPVAPATHDTMVVDVPAPPVPPSPLPAAPSNLGHNGTPASACAT